MSLPAPLLHRLPTSDRVALQRLLTLIDLVLPDAYNEALLDHQESRGDDGQTFGFRVYKYVRYALLQRTAHDADIHFGEENGAYFLLVGPLRIRVDSLGHFADDDVRGRFPADSPSKQDVGMRNGAQLQFAMPESEPRPGAGAFELDRLTVGHFGNPREGLVKWYIGAWSALKNGRRSWVWIERQDDPGAKAQPLKPRTPTPFTERDADTFVVVPRQSA